MRHRPAGIWLECKRLGYPARTEITSEGAIVALRRMGEAVEESMAALEHGARPDESAPREQRCADTGLCRPSGMQSFRPGALRQVLRSEEHTSELQSLRHLVCRLLLEK